MSEQVGTGGRGGRRRKDPANAPRLQAPSLDSPRYPAPTNIDDRTEGQVVADQILTSLGLAGQFSAQLGNLAQHEQFKRQQKEAKLDAEAQARLDQANEALKRQDDFFRGEAARDVGASAPDWEALIAKGGADIPQTTNRQAAEMFLTARLPDSLSPAYRDEFMKRAMPWVAEQIAKRRDTNDTQSKKVLLQNLKDGSGGYTSTEPMERAIDTAVKALGVDETVARGEIGLNALNLAAIRGEEDQFKAAMTVLGDNFKNEAAVEQARFESTLEGRKQDARNTLRDNVAAVRLDSRSFEAQRVEARKHLKTAGSDAVDTELRQIDAMEEAAGREAHKGRMNIAAMGVRSQMLDNAREIMNTTGAYDLPEVMEQQLPDGSTIRIKREDAAAHIVATDFEKIDAQQPDETVRAVQKINYLRKQGEDAVYQPWASTMNAAGTLANTASRQSDDPKAIPERLIAAVGLYRLLKTNGASSIVQSHVKDEASLEFLRLADAQINNVRAVPGKGAGDADIRDAIAAAARAHSAGVFDPSLKAGIPRDVAEKRAVLLAEELGIEDPGMDLAGVLRDKALAYRNASTGISEAAALDRAAADIIEDTRIIDGSLWGTRGTRVPRDAEDLLAEVKRAYMTEAGITNGVKPEDVRARFNAKTRTVSFTDPSGVRLPDSVVLSDRELAELSNYANSIKLAQLRVRGIESANTPDQVAKQRVLANARTLPKGIREDLKPIYELIAARVTDGYPYSFPTSKVDTSFPREAGGL